MPTITGTAGNDSLTGTTASDLIQALAGNDILDGLSGADTLEGGDGDDIFFVDDAGDQVVERLGGGSDLVYTSVNYALTDHVERLGVNGFSTTFAINLTGNGLANEMWGNDGVNILDGGAGADIMNGFAGNDVYIVDNAADLVVESAGGGIDLVYASVDHVLGAHVERLGVNGFSTTYAINLTGNDLDNEMWGNDGANILNGGAGADIMNGFNGNDTYFVDQAADVVVESSGGGLDTVFTSIDYALGGHVERLGANDFTTSFALNLTGNGLDNEMWGNDGANVINGGFGADIMNGNGGNDTYIVDDAGDLVAELPGDGLDTVFTSISHTLRSNVERLGVNGFTTSYAINLTGNALDNEMWGNDGVNLMNGGGGADLMTGFGGNDVYFVDHSGDEVREIAGGGSDLVYTDVTYTLAANVERLGVNGFATTFAIDLTGNAQDNELWGNDGANVINGGSGADIMNGNGGNDIFFVDNAGDAVVESAGGGFDLIYTSVDYTLGGNVERLAVNGFSTTFAINLTGNALDNEMWGNAGLNFLDGGGGADFIQGLGGIDFLNGGEGADTLIGGEGADQFQFTTALGAGNVDHIVDFAVIDERIRLAGGPGEPFAALATGILWDFAFTVGAAASRPSDMIIYNPATGALSYDADGNGAGAAVQFATLATGLNLIAFNFVVTGPVNTGPTISSASTATIVENSPTSTIVYQTAATDAEGDRILYSLSGTDAGLFTIDANGAVRLVAPADFETRSSYNIRVNAQDSSSNGSHKDLIVTVIDVADGPAPGATPRIDETTGPNDSTGSAQTIDRGVLQPSNNPNLPDDDLPSATIFGNLPNSSDRDFFAITLQAGEKLILDVDNTSGNLDAHIRVYGPSGSAIGDNDDPGTLDPGSSPHPEYGHNTDSFFSFRAPTAGTYYFSIESFQDPENPTFGSYEINVSIGPAATAAQILDEDIDALIDSLGWPDPDAGRPGTNLTYGFPNSPADYTAANSDETSNNFEGFNATQQNAATLMLQSIASVANLTFDQLFSPEDGNGTLLYAMSDEPDVAYAFLPGPRPGGTMWFRNSPIEGRSTPSFDNPVPGGYAWMSILHETGHALGLKHGHEAPAISFDRDSVEYTVMTYRSYPGNTVGDGYGNEPWGFPSTLMALDIAALQRMYGANFGFNAGNNVYTWSPTSGQSFVDGVGGLSPGGGGGGSSNRVFMTVWDGGGTDTYDLSNYSNGVTIDLRPGEWTTTSAVQLANLGDGNFARGNVLNAYLFEGDTRSLIENAVGGSGADTLIANQAANVLTGGGGGDDFIWRSLGDTGVGAQADVIADFVSLVDDIGLSDIDANANTAGVNDAFTFIGTSAFSNVAGQLRYQVEGGNARIQGDVNGDAIADFEIVVNNVTSLSSSDFFF